MGKSITINVFYRAGSKVVKIDAILRAILFLPNTINSRAKRKSP
jgi:hypothetical protein